MRQGASPLAAMRWTLPNILTISRVPMMFVVVGLMFVEAEWPAATITFWLFIASALTDWFDGMLARRANQVSSFGRFMDATIDKVMVLGLMIALVNGNFFGQYTMVAMLLLLCILAREFTISGLRMAAAVKGITIEADAGGKLKTFVQLNAIGWLLGAKMLEVDFGQWFVSAPWFTPLVHKIGLILYVLSAILTITSGYNYFRRHGHVVKD
jgi:CDP-diacylglycerol--glycerol-3-phosphate 3-phosphatidyltransferase